jgi:LIM interaction domain (LID)
MIVGEPSLMGGDMDDEDERYITRIENAQYDPNVGNSSHPAQYLSPTHPMPPGFHPGLQQQQNPNLQSILHHKQQFMSNPTLIHPSQMKREQMPYPGSPQQQHQQQLPSMFSTSGGPPTPNANNVFPPPSTPINGEVTTVGKRISSSSSPPTPSTNHNQVCSKTDFILVADERLSFLLLLG